MKESAARAKALRAITNLYQTDFARYYNIPLSTWQSWEQGKNEPPEYVLELLERAVRADFPKGWDE